MIFTGAPGRPWDYGITHESEIMSRTARGTDEITGIERIKGNTPDISEWTDFSFYNLVWYQDFSYSDAASPEKSLGSWLGVAHRVDSDLCYWILNSNGKVLARTTAQHVVQEDCDNQEINLKIDKSNKDVNNRLYDENFIIEGGESKCTCRM